MTKYSLDIAQAKLGKDGLAITEGWIAVYSASSDSREFIGVNNEYLALGVSLPASGYADAPTLPIEDDKAVRRNVAGTAWEIVTDLRGQIAYSTQTGEAEVVKYIADLPDTLTLLAPQTVFDKWNGKKWVTDNAAQQAAVTQVADEKKAQLLSEATAIIAPLQDAKNDGYIDDADIPRLAAWQKYRYELTKVDVSNAVWPTPPAY
ncbi:tail fiber assembly protein [Yersinia thracica]|uniref:tail fiber assembly protein n=1 Tax=Yersinia thracica TaxID=2890319 RepID=UPI00157D4DA8|nr:tail fiber assembly protein [Yersinia thracica]